MNRASDISLGVITAIGGFVDMGELVTCSEGGATYGYALLWTGIVGVLGIIVFTEMSGRVAIASGRGINDVIRERLGFRLGFVSLAISVVVNVLTVVIEICGMSLVIESFTRLAYLWFVPVTALILFAVLWFGSFKVIENAASMLGLAILIFVPAAFVLPTDWGSVLRESVFPTLPGSGQLANYGFAAVGLLGALMTPYEIYFYSSGAIEEHWTGSDFIMNRITTLIGYTFGVVLVMAMMIVSADTYFVHGVSAQYFENVSVPLVMLFGGMGMVFFAFGGFAITAGAGLEALLSTGFCLCQFFGWDWGKNHRPKDAPIFTFTLVLALVAALLITFTGVDPVKMTIYTTALAAFSLPFAFFPLLLVANDATYMGNQKNGLLSNIAAGFFLVILCGVTVVTLPLFIMAGGGS